MGMLVLTLSAYSLPQGPLFASVEQPKNLGGHYLAKNASRWHFNAKFGQIGTIVKN